jgi:uncharacterized membrane protein YhaH (DUF805 family)
MTFGQSISTCFSKYIGFSGRASRSEYLWFVLVFIPIIGIIVLIYWFVQRGTIGENRFGPEPQLTAA